MYVVYEKEKIQKIITYLGKYPYNEIATVIALLSNPVKEMQENDLKPKQEKKWKKQSD